MLDPALWRVAATGRFNGIDVATKGPARIVLERGGYRLEPATLAVDKGTLRLAGRYGPMALRRGWRASISPSPIRSRRGWGWGV